jgi:hypothetical protein
VPRASTTSRRAAQHQLIPRRGGNFTAAALGGEGKKFQNQPATPRRTAGATGFFDQARARRQRREPRPSASV